MGCLFVSGVWMWGPIMPLCVQCLCRVFRKSISHFVGVFPIVVCNLSGARTPGLVTTICGVGMKL